MPFFIVADRPDLRIFNRAEFARDALALATQRRLTGAEAVFVYDTGWMVIDAPSLEAAAHRESDLQQPAAAPWHEPSRAKTFIVGGADSGTGAGTRARASRRARPFRRSRPDAASEG